jgi:nucleotide-binding universal stress UspA family protein
VPAPERPLIVVGYDGSPVSRLAVERGIDRVTGAGRLVVVHAYEIPIDFVGLSFYQEALDALAESAGRTLDELERTEPRLREVSYERALVLGPPASAITETASERGADEIILGTRGVGRFRGLLGSVAHGVLHRAGCPVLIIPERLVEATRDTAEEQAA